MAKKIENPNSKPTHEEIATLARAIYEQKGCVPGQDLENWLEAEKRLMATRNGTSQQKIATRPASQPMPR